MSVTRKIHTVIHIGCVCVCKYIVHNIVVVTLTSLKNTICGLI